MSVFRFERVKKSILCLFFAVVSCKYYKVSNSEVNDSPKCLSVEFIREPESLLIVDNSPEFSWELSEVTEEQSSYQLLVSSSKENIANGVGDIWDSKRVISSQSINVVFNGGSLNIGETYFWKVKIWDSKNKESKYSKYQQFTIGEKQGKNITSANRFQIEKIEPKIFNKNANGSYFVDFGKAAFATLEFRYESEINDTLVFHIGEQLVDGQVNRNPQGTIRYQKVKVPVSPDKSNYKLSIKPDKRNTKSVAISLPDSFPVLMPFRYVEIEKTKEKLIRDEFYQVAYFSYWNDALSHFKSSDTILNQVWDLCKYTIKATTFTGLYVDGDRERIPYEADAYLNQLSHYTNDREYAIARQTMEYFMEQPTWPTEWQLHVILMFYADYMYTGNTELIETYYDELKHKSLMELRREDGLISSKNATPEFMKKIGFKNTKAKLKDIVDWPPAQKDTKWKLATEEGERDGFVFKPINTVINCLYYRNLTILIEFAELLEKPEEALEIRQLALQVKENINTKLFDSKIGVYTDGEGTNNAALHSNMMALAFDIVPERNVKSVVDFIKSRGMACSVYGAQYLLEALYNAGEDEYALKMMTALHDRSWYHMIEIGSTMTLESWDMKYKPNADWNHAWGAAPANIIPRYLWGIKPKVAGYSVATINPQLGGLKRTSIVVPTLRGQIAASFVLDEDKTQRFEVTIPGNMHAEFMVIEDAILKLNGENIVNHKGIVKLTPGKSIIEIMN